MKRVLVFAAAVALLSGDSAFPQGPAEGRTGSKRIRVERDPETFVTVVKIQSEGGQVAWSDVFVALAQARGFDDGALGGVLPDGRFPITGPIWRLTVAGINALNPGIHFSVEPSATPEQDPWLVIRMDRAALLASPRRFTRLFRPLGSPLLDRFGDRYGLFLEEGWQDLPVSRNIVVFVHGLKSDSQSVRGLLELAKAEGFPCATFCYPTDRAVDDSARALARELAALAEDAPGRCVSLVAHSMGGLVARAAVEDPALDPGNVRQLIMIGTPNRGSNLAWFGFALNLVEPILEERRRAEVGSFYEAVEDGLSEASGDLIPGSSFLQTLNARPRNPKVQYSLFLGDRGILSQEELDSLRQHIAEQGDRNRWVRFFGSRADTFLAELDEVVQGKGDGAVAVERGRLEGVEDTVVLSFGHLEVLNTPGTADAKKVHEGVIARLKAPGAAR